MSTSPPDIAGGRLLAVYRAYIGEPDSRTDVYLGFAAFFAGLGLGLFGLLLFVYERGLIAGDAFGLRQIAFAAGALGLPLVLVSVTILLPTDRRAVYLALGGFLVTFLAVGFFVSVYPSNWNYGTPDYSLQGVTVYAIGLLGVLSATATALVGYHVERAQGGPVPIDPETGEPREPTPGAVHDADPEAVAEQVQRDIDEATAATDITWGGVEKVETERLRINTDATLEEVDIDQSSAKVHRSAGIDEAVAGLQGLQGGMARTDSGGGVDDQANALRELREQQRREAEASPDGVVDRVRSLLDRDR